MLSFSRVPLVIRIFCVLVLTFALIFLTVVARRHWQSERARRSCRSNIGIIEVALAQAKAANTNQSLSFNLDSLAPYFFRNTIPCCPSKGAYVFTGDDDHPIMCTIHGDGRRMTK